MAQCCRARQSPVARLVLDLELALFGHALKRFARIFDPVLVIVAIGRQQLDDFVGPTGARTTDGARRVKHCLTDSELVRSQYLAAH